MLRAAPTSTSSPKSSSNAAVGNTKSFMLHPKQLVALRSKATEILYGAANRGKRPLLSWSGWRHIEGPATASIQNDSGLAQDLPALPRQPDHGKLAQRVPERSPCTTGQGAT